MSYDMVVKMARPSSAGDAPPSIVQQSTLYNGSNFQNAVIHI